MVDLIASASYNICFLGNSLTASGLPAVILHVGSLFTKITVAGGCYCMRRNTTMNSEIDPCSVSTFCTSARR